MDKCECNNPGFCNRHNVNKGEREFELCKSKSGFRFFEILYGKKSKPTIVEKAVNLGIAISKDIMNGMKRSSEETAKIRLDICNNCPLLDSDRSCMSCGCPVDEKVKIDSERCPEGKWEGYSESKKCSKCNR